MSGVRLDILFCNETCYIKHKMCIYDSNTVFEVSHRQKKFKSDMLLSVLPSILCRFPETFLSVISGRRRALCPGPPLMTLITATLTVTWRSRTCVPTRYRIALLGPFASSHALETHPRLYERKYFPWCPTYKRWLQGKYKKKHHMK